MSCHRAVGQHERRSPAPRCAHHDGDDGGHNGRRHRSVNAAAPRSCCVQFTGCEFFYLGATIAVVHSGAVNAVIGR